VHGDLNSTNTLLTMVQYQAFRITCINWQPT